MRRRKPLVLVTFIIQELMYVFQRLKELSVFLSMTKLIGSNTFVIKLLSEKWWFYSGRDEKLELKDVSERSKKSS